MKTLQTTVLSYSISKLTSKYLFCYHATNTSNHLLRKKTAFLGKWGDHLICCTKLTLCYVQTSSVSPPTSCAAWETQQTDVKLVDEHKRSYSKISTSPRTESCILLLNLLLAFQIQKGIKNIDNMVTPLTPAFTSLRHYKLPWIWEGKKKKLRLGMGLLPNIAYTDRNGCCNINTRGKFSNDT